MCRYFFLAALAAWSCVAWTQAQTYTCYGTSANTLVASVDQNDVSCSQAVSTAFGITPDCDNKTSRYDSNAATCTGSTCLSVAFVVGGFDGVHYGSGCVSGTSVTATVCIAGEPSATVAPTTTTTAAATTTTAGSVTSDDMSGTTEDAETTTVSVSRRRRKRAAAESELTCATVTLDGDILNCSLVGTLGVRTNTAAHFSNQTTKGYELSVAALPVQCCTEDNCNNITGAAPISTQYVCKSGTSDTFTADTTNTKTCQGCWGLVTVDNGTTTVSRGCQEDLNSLAFAGSDFSTLTCATTATCNYVNGDDTKEECFLCCAGDECNAGYTEAVIRAGEPGAGMTLQTPSVFTFLATALMWSIWRY